MRLLGWADQEHRWPDPMFMRSGASLAPDGYSGCITSA
jgi:hypothetical protein